MLHKDLFIYPGYIRKDLPFRGNSSEKPELEKTEQIEPNTLAASKEAASGTRAIALAQILVSNRLKYSTTPDEYERLLVKQGKIKDKDYFVSVDDVNSSTTYINEVNSDGKTVKQTEFHSGNEKTRPENIQKYFNPQYPDCPYRTVANDYNGYSIMNFDVKTRKILNSYGYNNDNKLSLYMNDENNTAKHYNDNGSIDIYNTNFKE